MYGHLPDCLIFMGAILPALSMGLPVEQIVTGSMQVLYNTAGRDKSRRHIRKQNLSLCKEYGSLDWVFPGSGA